MRIGVISDTHGNKMAIRRAVATVGPVEMWLHAGDYSQDADFLAELTGLPLVVVAGNCDGGSTAKIDEFVSAGDRKIWLTHGHRYRAKERTGELAWWAGQYGVDAVIYGHSHIPVIDWIDGRLIFNPGSAAYPRGGSRASCGLLVVAGGDIRAEILVI